MKAVQYDRFGGPEVLQYVDLPDPRPGPGEVLIQTAAIGVNFPDIRERLGVYNKAETRVGGVQLPQVGGIAVAGTVVDNGSDTSGDLIGRRVVALMKKGAYAERAVAAEALCAVVDDDADVIVLAGFAAQAACAHLLLQASTTLRPGEAFAGARRSRRGGQPRRSDRKGPWRVAGHRHRQHGRTPQFRDGTRC